MDGAGAKPSEISVGEVDTNKMFLLPEFVERILGYLDEKDLLQARGVNRAIWKPEAEKWLQKRFQKKLEPTSALIAYSVTDAAETWLSECVKTATWFKSTSQIKEFLQDMEACEGNPFPNRTVVICLPNENRKLTLGELGCLDSEFTKLMMKFGEEIWNIFVIIPFGPYDVFALRNLFTLSNLEFLCLLSSWYYLIDRDEEYQLEKFARDRAKLEKLKTLCIFSNDSHLYFKNLFWNTGNANQLEALHIPAENIKHFGLGTLPVRRLFLDGLSAQFQFHSDFIGNRIFYQLEELRLTFLWATSFKIESIGTILRLYDWAGFNTLKTLSICVYPNAFLSYHNSEGAGNGVEKFAHDRFNFPGIVNIQNPVKYLALRELTIDFNILEGFPQLLTVFSVKFPKWEVLHLEAMNKGFCKRFYASVAELFEDVCQELWNYVPDTVRLITGERASLKAYRPSKPHK